MCLQIFYGFCFLLYKLLFKRKCFKNSPQFNDLVLKIETWEDGPQLSCDWGRARPTPHISGRSSFRGYWKPEFFFSFLKPGFVTSSDHFPSVVSTPSWVPVDSCPCKAAQKCVARSCPALGQLSANVRLRASPPLLICTCVFASLYRFTHNSQLFITSWQ